MHNQPRRHKSKRSIGRVMHIICEDSKSARYYLQGYKKDKNLKEYIEFEPHKYTDPLNLVEDAKRIKKENPNDTVWVVYDSESPQQRDIKKEHAKAWQNANDSQINVVLSCVSFETWILLHHKYSTAFFQCSDDLESHIQEKLDKDYTKKDEGIYKRLKSKVEEARNNAIKLKKHNKDVNPSKKPYEMNPYTDIHKLLDAMSSFKNS